MKTQTGFQPFKDRVLLRQLEADTMTAGGILLPDEAQKKPQQGEVIAVGSEVEETRVGDVVVFAQYAGTKAEFDGNEYIIINEEDLLGRT